MKDYFSKLPRILNGAGHVTVLVDHSIPRQSLFGRTNYQDNIREVGYQPGNVPTETFYFLISFGDNWHPDVRDFDRKDINFDDPLTWGPKGTIERYFHIPEEICNRVRLGNAKILVHNDHVNFHEKLIDAWLTWAKHRYQLNEDHFVWLMPFLRYNRPAFIANNTWENQIETVVARRGENFRKELHSNVVEGRPRKYKFVCLNARPSLSRLMSVTKLYDYKDQGLLTYREDLDIYGVINHSLKQLQDYDSKLVKKYKKLTKEFPLSWDITNREDYDRVALVDDIHVDNLLDIDCYLNIVTETCYKNTYPIWPSEKIFRPIMLYQPFVVLAPQGTLQELRSLGFSTFNQWIDESYDKIENDIERMDAALDAAIKFLSQEPESLISIMQEMLPVLHHNRSVAELRFLRNTLDVINPMVRQLTNTGAENSMNVLVYNNRYPQTSLSEKIIASPFAIKELHSVFDARTLAQTLPEDKFYFQLDREFLDLAWMELELKEENPRKHELVLCRERVPVEVINRVKNKNAFLLIPDAGKICEVSEQRYIDFIQILINTLDTALSVDNFVVLGPAYNTNRIQLIQFNFWETFYTKAFAARFPRLTQTIVDRIRSKKSRQHRFICLLNRTSEIRMLTTTLLNDIKDTGVLTLPKVESGGMYSENQIRTSRKLFEGMSPVLSAKFAREIEPTLPWQWDIDKRTGGADNKSTAENIDYYDQYRVWMLEDSYVEGFLDCYLNVVSETCYIENSVLLSEKTFKAINHLMPFVIIGQPGALRALRDKGFKTFNSWIDESYDDIPDSTLRTFAVVQEVKRIAAMTTEQLDNMLIEMLPVLMHNKKLLEYRAQTVWDQMAMEASYLLNRQNNDNSGL